MTTRLQHSIFYVNKNTGEVEHVYSQDTPIKEDFTPIVADNDNNKSFDLVNVLIETDNINNKHVSASFLMEELEVDDGDVIVKVDKPANQRKFTLRKVMANVKVNNENGKPVFDLSQAKIRDHRRAKKVRSK